MTTTHVWLVSLLALGFGVFQGCSGDSTTDVQPSAGSGGSSSNGGKDGQGGVSALAGGNNDSAGETGTTTCSPDECGPQLGLPNFTCEDGSIGGPTGRCLLRDGVCGWEIRECPVTGAGGAGGAGSQGGYANDAGAPAGGASSDRCGGCDSSGAVPKTCIYQAGGPGPAHYTCATQNPCGAAGVCACIVNQGTCSNTLMDGYCVCDNGLE